MGEEIISDPTQAPGCSPGAFPVDQLMRASSQSGQSETFRRRLDDDQGRGELTEEATKISYSSQIHLSSTVHGSRDVFQLPFHKWWYLAAGLPATLRQFGSGLGARNRGSTYAYAESSSLLDGRHELNMEYQYPCLLLKE